jgi:DNA mismatch repair protein MutL
MPIKVLPPDLASKIAAGEVIERPASVVKELLENSLDAGASSITVEIKGGGSEEVRVIDDGAGIPSDEVRLAFLRHATSKLASPEDLDAVATLGFRGEALPSIAAVSHLSLTSRTTQSDAGHEIEIKWGQLVRDGSRGSPPGTNIRVSGLFENLPARKKFLRTPGTESGRVQDLVTRYALAFPSVRFQLTSEGRRLLSTPGSGNPRETCLAVYGKEVAEGMLEIEGEDPESGYRVKGLISPPHIHRANRNYISLFVNQRWIQSRMLGFALEESYHGLLPVKRYPIAAINLSVPYGEVDVNSHPSKREVRFHHEGAVFRTLQRTVRGALVADSPVRSIQSPSGTQTLPGPAGFESSSFFPRGAFGGRQTVLAGGPPEAAAPIQPAPALKVVGQVKATYIVAEGPDGMYLVDQHAAHERILFDQITQITSDWLPSRPGELLLEPVTVDLSAGQVEVLRENAEMLARYGFAVEPFGDNGYLVRAVPGVMTSQDPGQSLLSVLDMVALEGLVRQQEDILAASIACHSAIRAGKSLTETEMRALLEQLEATANPHTCPHGRPTMLHFSESHMEQGFGRR